MNIQLDWILSKSISQIKIIASVSICVLFIVRKQTPCKFELIQELVNCGNDYELNNYKIQLSVIKQECSLKKSTAGITTERYQYTKYFNKVLSYL